MQCPKCHCKLKIGVDKHSNTEIDYCRQCKGIWLDKNELVDVCKFAVWQVSLPSNAVESKCLCPRCEINMYEFEYPETMVQVEMCPGCNGFWLDSGEIKEIELVRRNWVISKHRPKTGKIKKIKSGRSCKNPGGKQPDYSLPDDKKYKRLDFIAKSIVVFVALTISVTVCYIVLFGWKYQAKLAKRELQEYYTKMPNYEDNREYIQQLIDANHQQIYPKCKYISETGTTRKSFSYSFDKKRYLSQMKENIATQAKKEKNKDVLEWTNNYDYNKTYD